ncbi:type II toxin-antitoxin system death-on-curing family toxin [Streptomyces sp. NPDC007808]|uniref:type II toxin-antitoxin system death-on-curing family toxin n=1 Tax=Streptomyces sp. NPDC007808 TaxID=3364779 RepID=UPI00369A3BD6
MSRRLTVAEVAFGGGRPRPGSRGRSRRRRTGTARMFGMAAYEGLYERAAVLLRYRATDHPLVDGDKRTDRLAAATLLGVSGVGLASRGQDAAYDLVIDAASGDESDIRAIAGRPRPL